MGVHHVRGLETTHSAERSRKNVSDWSLAIASMPVPMQHEKKSVGGDHPVISGLGPACVLLTPVPSG